MRTKTFPYLYLALTLPFLFSCGKEPLPVRPHDPWVFRSVLDSIPRIATAALHDDLFIAYRTQTGSVYKAWKGSVNFDGAVYTTAHGPQPSSLGNNWFVNRFEEPWRILQDGREVRPAVQYRGHRFEEGQVWFNYELRLDDGTVVQVSERPEYVSREAGQTGLERTFRTASVPAGMQVSLRTNLSSVALESSVETDGDWQVTARSDRSFRNLDGLDLEGTLGLVSNGDTRFTVYFTKAPLLENPNRVAGEETAENLPLGLRIMARNDCKTCHNTFVATVGPSYVDVAKRYRNTPDNIGMLVTKVKNGGSGVWGQAAMTAHADLPDEDIREMVGYIMGLDSLEEAAIAAIPASEKEMEWSEGADISESDMLPGVVVRAYQYDRTLNRLDDLAPFPTPVFEGVVPALQASGNDFGGLTENFSVVAEGYFKIPKRNNYVFRLVSDDGSRLFVNGKLVVDNDGLHGDEARDGELALEEGYHPFRMEYFQGGGGRTISLQMKSFDGEGGMFGVVPPGLLAHRKTDTPTGFAGAGSFGKKMSVPGDRSPVEGVHPSFDLSQARPADFFPKVGGMDFLPDGRLVVSLWDAEGGVYVLENVQSGDPARMKATKIASGLAEPLGLKVVDGDIYVLQKQELTRLVDHDGDGLTDEYRTVCNAWGVSSNFHEFAFGLAYKDGYFYGSLATDILPGGAGAPVQPKDRGRTFRIAREDGRMELVTSGLRTPNGIGIGVDGEIFNADNQGDWLPSSKIVHIRPGAFYGSRAVDFDGTAQLAETPPVVWLPQDEIGNSPSTPLAFDEGPYKGQMIHGEVTHGGIKRVFVEKINGAYQGCVFRFTQGLEAGVNRLVWGPDGALYVGGVGNPGNWQHGSGHWYGLQRLRYNGQTTFEMLAVRARSNGLEIEFTEPLEAGIGWEAKAYDIQQWRYQPTAEYGGPKLDLTALTVRRASVSEDRTKVFLELSGMKEGHVIYVHLPNHWISENGRELWSTEGWYTMNQVPADLPVRSLTPPVLANNSLTEQEKALGWELLFDGKSLAGWHTYGKSGIGKDWVVQDEAIHLDVGARNKEGWQSEDGGDIITEQSFANYELRLDWKIAPCGNSGIIYNVVEDADKYTYGWQTGPEMQVLDNTCHPDAMIEKHRAGDLYDLIACSYETVRPAGQWNQVRLVNRNGRVEHWLNGRKLVEVDMTGDAWRSLVAGSKFKDMPDFGKSTAGKILLQDHGDKVWFRNIKIRKLD